MSDNETKIAEMLKIDLLNMAEWRRRKADEFPADTRNAASADMLERLAGTAGQVDPGLLRAYTELLEDLTDGEKHSDLLREIGFGWEPESASEFVSRFVALAAGTV